MAEDECEIILCFECGAKNRLKRGWTGAPICGKCGEPLPAQARPVSHPSGSASASGLRVPLRLLALVGIGFLAVVGYLAVEETQSSDKKAAPNPYLALAPSPEPTVPPTTNRLSTDGLVPLDAGHERDIQATPAPLPPRQPILAPVNVRPGIILKHTTADFVAPFQIKTSPGANYFVKLVDAITGKSVVGIYVVGGWPLEVDVPLGRYEMRYASGQTWYGFKHLFGPDTTYAKADDTFDFAVQGNQVSGYTVELIRQVHGNLDTRPIDASQF